ncbi:MAG: hypothetical protein LBP22_00390 [Deltaproteobacteria bacterium]|jgi:hypothetical protein|nr:hypothetical protein [Deltaproteobacteria bacterium]
MAKGNFDNLKETVNGQNKVIVFGEVTNRSAGEGSEVKNDHPSSFIRTEDKKIRTSNSGSKKEGQNKELAKNRISIALTDSELAKLNTAIREDIKTKIDQEEHLGVLSLGGWAKRFMFFGIESEKRTKKP